MAHVIDFSVGHGPERGWQGVRSVCGLSEYQFNHGSLRPALQKLGTTQSKGGLSLRWWDAAEHPEWRRKRKGNLLLLDRLRAIFQGAAGPPSILIALHNNASRNPRYGGFMAIYRREKDGRIDQRSKRLAELLCEHLEEALLIRNLGVQADTGSWVSRNLALPRWSHRYGTAGVILELGFLTCARDVKILRAKETPEKAARAIFAAVESFDGKRTL